MTKLFTCVGKGGTYEYVGLAKGAGTKRDAAMLEIYRDTATGALYYRTESDFSKRMVELVDDPERLAQVKRIADLTQSAGPETNLGEVLYDAGFRFIERRKK